MEADADCRELFTDCPDSPTADIVLEYARNNTRWHEDFGPAFQILIENGYARSELVEAVDISSTTDDEESTSVATNVKAAFVVLAVGAVVAALFQ